MTAKTVPVRGVVDQRQNKIKEYFADPTTHFLNLSGSGINIDGVKTIASLLEKNKSIVVLNLSRNQIDSQCIEILANALRKNTTLCTLYLCENNLGDDVAKAISQLISVGSLSHLNLYCNSIGDQVAKGIAEALQTNKTMEKLYLQGNLIGDEGAMAIGEALKTRPMRVLNLSGNRISAPVLAELKNICSHMILLDLGTQDNSENIAPVTSDSSKGGGGPSKGPTDPTFSRSMTTPKLNILGSTQCSSPTSARTPAPVPTAASTPGPALTPGAASAPVAPIRLPVSGKSLETITAISTNMGSKRKASSRKQPSRNIQEKDSTRPRAKSENGSGIPNPSKIQDTSIPSKLQDNKKTTDTTKLPSVALATSNEKVLTAQIDHLKQKLGIMEQKYIEALQELTQSRDQVLQLHVALGASYELIQGLQAELKRFQNDS